MGTTKESLMTAGGVEHQQALVKLLLPKISKKVKYKIPAGKTLFTSKNEKNLIQLESMLYTWLRKVRAFEDCTLAFVNDLTKFRSSRERVVEFPEGKVPVWSEIWKGRGYLAKVLAELIDKNGPLLIEIKKDGIYLFKDLDNKLEPGSEEWEPSIEFTKSQQNEYAVY